MPLGIVFLKVLTKEEFYKSKESSIKETDVRKLSDM
jgi:hypothetical protein